MTSTEKYVAVEVNAFGRGMQTMFQGVAEIFASMGVAPPHELEEKSRKWNPDEKGDSEEHENEAARSESAVPDGTAPDSVSSDDCAPTVSEEVEEDTAESGTDEAEKEQVAHTEAPEPKKPAKKPGRKAAEKAPDTPAVTSDAAPATTVSQDDITKIIVQKIKQNRANNEKIGQILKSYGAAKVSDLSPGQCEAFITDIAAI